MGGVISINALTFAGSRLTPCLEIYFAKNGICVCLNKHFSLFHFRLACLHQHNICSNLWSWSQPSASNPTLQNHWQYQRHWVYQWKNCLFSFGTYCLLMLLQMAAFYTETCHMARKMLLSVIIVLQILGCGIWTWYLSVWST